MLVPIQSRKAARLESLQPWQSPRVQKLGVATACPHPMANRDVFLNDFHDSVQSVHFWRGVCLCSFCREGFTIQLVRIAIWSGCSLLSKPLLGKKRRNPPSLPFSRKAMAKLSSDMIRSRACVSLVSLSPPVR